MSVEFVSGVKAKGLIFLANRKVKPGLNLRALNTYNNVTGQSEAGTFRRSACTA